MTDKTQANRAQKTFDGTAVGPLDGVRVLDLSRLVSGNVLSMLLGDFGADVVKIEPLGGDPLREWKDAGASLFWKTYSRNKKSLALNLRMPEAKEVLLKLVATADALVENFKPGTLEVMGLAPEVLWAANPDLVIVRISGFGQDGPYSSLPGFGSLVEAMSGLAARTGFADREPVLPPFPVADMVAGIYGAMATLVALRAREHNLARGQVVDLSLLEPLFSLLGPEAAIFQLTGQVKERCGSASNTTAPRNVYRCSDGKYVALSGSMQSMATRIFDEIGRSDMNLDPRFSNNTARIANRDAVDQALGEWFASETREEALEAMRAAEATVGPVYNIDDAMEDEHFIAREIIVDVADDDLGTIPMANIVPRLSETPGTWRLPAPKIGEHTAALLAEIGMTPSEIEKLRDIGASV